MHCENHLYSLDRPSGGPVATEISLATGAPFEMGAVRVAPDAAGGPADACGRGALSVL
jgi:hypothetical protein